MRIAALLLASWPVGFGFASAQPTNRQQRQQPQPPHIVMIIADDLGWNDISLHGSPQIPTPNIDALAEGGVQLAMYHAQPVCSPSRSSFLSGRHVIHTGVYSPFDEGSPLHLRLDVTLLPTYLKRCCNYSTAAVGKWHLGHNTLGASPVGRGMDTYVGYFNGAEDHYDHMVAGAYDYNAGVTPQPQYNNTWSTELFSSAAIDIIQQHGTGGPMSGRPLFLYLAYQDVHWPLQAPQAYLDRFANTTGGNTERQHVCAMAAHLDDGIGNVTRALKQAGLWDNTLLIFQADNGGPTNGNEGTSSNNYPLRGGKNTLWEGGTRVDAIVRGAGIQKVDYVSHEMYHATDWLPTLVEMASGRDWTDFILPTEPQYEIGDGMSVWKSLSTGAPSPRNWLLLEAHPRNSTGEGHGDALIVGDMKVIRWWLSPAEENGWFPPPGQNPASTSYSISCGPPPPSHNASQCQNAYCLFNVTADPCEFHDLAAALPDVLASLVAQLAPFQDTAVPPLAPQGCAPARVPLDDGRLVWQPCDSPCVSDSHCNRNGACVGGQCVCAPAWRGFRCGELALGNTDPAAGFNHVDAGTSSWGGSVVFAPEDGSYHLFYSRLEGGCLERDALTNSACYRAVSNCPVGPFVNDTLVLPAFCNNAGIVRANDGTYLLWHVGDGLEAGGVINCSQSRAQDGGPVTAAAGGGAAMRASDPTFNTYSFSTTGINGPWVPAGHSAFNGTHNSSDWDAIVVSTSPWVLPDGSVLLAFTGKKQVDGNTPHLGIARAPSWQGPFTRISPDPLMAIDGTVGSDPFLWVTDAGVGHILFHGGGAAPAGQHAFTPVPNSFDNWVLSADAPFSLDVTWLNQTTVALLRRERPSLVFDGASGGAPVGLVTAAVPVDAFGRSFTMVTPIFATGVGAQPEGPT